MAAAAAASSSSSSPGWNYDVFLSFRGEDTRKNFVDHLYSALKDKGIYTFKDDEKLKRGESISQELIKAIKESRIAIIIFSTNYASSTWCLDELVEIIKCKSTMGQTVLPIFYNVAPSRVRKQKKSFAEAFRKHEEAFGKDNEKMQSWRNALVEAANISGFEPKKIANGDSVVIGVRIPQSTTSISVTDYGAMDNDLHYGRTPWVCDVGFWVCSAMWDFGFDPPWPEPTVRHEAKAIRIIVQEIIKKLGRIPLDIAKYQVGIDSRVNKVITLLDNELNDVHIVGIYGTGGAGKTTIAKAVYKRIFDQFENCCFLSDVRKVSEQQGLTRLQEQLLNDILMEEDSKICNVDYGTCVIKRRLRFKKVLVVLDDVDHSDQLESLAVGNGWFGSGSKIIITTRNERLLVEQKVDHDIYKVELLDDDEALQLFSYHAFTMRHPPKDYAELSSCVITYAKGLPLAFQVLGSFLFKRSTKEWEHELDNLKRIPNGDIHDVLKISFSGLNDPEKDLFLDIACFFNGYHKDSVMDILSSSGFYPRIPILVERSLVTISNNKLQMHDLIQEMGKEIVRQESPDDPGKRSRLWFHEDIYKVLEENTATETIRGIMLNMPHDDDHLSEGLLVNVDIFAKMKRLKVLKLSGIRTCGRLTYLSNELSYLDWEGYPTTCLPSNFRPQKLVHLYLRDSRIKQILSHMKFLGKLKLLNLSYCPYLEKTIDLSSLPFLEDLNLTECANLVEVHLSDGVHERVVRLNLSACEKLKSLPKIIRLKNLEYFDLGGCSKLETFPEIQGDMDRLRELILYDTAIKDLPSSIEHLGGLRILMLSNCKKLKSLPTNMFWKMKELNEFQMQGTAMKQLPSSIQHLSSIATIILDNSWMQIIGTELLCGLSTLRSLFLHKCNLSEESLPRDFGRLSSLEELDISENNFTSIPASFIQLTNLESLELEDCTSLRTLTSLPSSIRYVNANGCKSLEWYWFPPCVKSQNYRWFKFTGCNKLVMDQSNNMPNIYSQSQLQEIGQMIYPGSEIPPWFGHIIEGESSSVCLGVDDHHLPSYDNVKLQIGQMICPISENIPPWFGNIIEGEISSVCLGVDDHHLPSYDNVKGIVVCLALEFHGIVASHEVRLVINGSCESLLWNAFDRTNGLNNVLLAHITEYYSKSEKACRPIKHLLNKNPSIVLKCVQGNHKNEELTAKIKKWGIHLVMEEQGCEEGSMFVEQQPSINSQNFL
ncbi:disease resistance protein RUN1-like [Cornus florida]|uniref:disease resistance protein RUN1-like n=1 Tax=Cornus florida TaxID=4283 RepID=UPI002898D3EE|nr:disease resistance protein RUN1-like [Cornus florida]